MESGFRLVLNLCRIVIEYRIAEVSMDWDKEFAGYIRDIYHETHNPVIRVQNSGFESSLIDSSSK